MIERASIDATVSVTTIVGIKEIKRGKVTLEAFGQKHVLGRGDTLKLTSRADLQKEIPDEN